MKGVLDMQLDHAVEDTGESKETFLCTHTRGYFYQGLGTGQKVYYNLDDSLEVLNLSTLALGHMTARQIIESGTNNFWNDMWIPSPDVLRLRNTSISSLDMLIDVTAETGQRLLITSNCVGIDTNRYNVDRDDGVLFLKCETDSGFDRIPLMETDYQYGWVDIVCTWLRHTKLYVDYNVYIRDDNGVKTSQAIPFTIVYDVFMNKPSMFYIYKTHDLITRLPNDIYKATLGKLILKARS